MWVQLFHHTGKMIRLIVRRDRMRLPIWLIALTVITVISASSLAGAFHSQEERQAIAETMKNPAVTAMVGPGYGVDHYTVGAMMAHQMLLFTAIAVAIMSILLVTRHTRTDEEEGRIEFIRSLPVGRLSNVSATVIVLFITHVLLALTIGFGLFALGFESMDLHGSLLYGAALGTTGMFFTGVTVLFAQASGNTRGTIGFSFAALLIAYLIRAIGDVSSEALSMLSPLGWILRTEVYVSHIWWPVFLTVASALILVGIALYLNAIRDLGAGIIPSRPGRRHASNFLLSPLGLPFRLQRTGIIAWAIGMLLLGLSYGSVFGDLETFLNSNDMMRELLQPMEGLSLTEQYLTMLMSVITIISTIPPLMILLKLKGEEKRQHTEQMLACAAVSRSRLLGSYFILSMIMGFVVLCLANIGLWSAATAVMDDPISFATMLQASMVYLPAIWVMIGVTVLLLGFLPTFASITWLYLGYSFLVIYLGELLQFPDWMGKLTPFGHIPQLPVEEFDVIQVIAVTCIAIVLVISGFIGYKRRDIGA
ncbi:ABC transporter permease [Caldalkalibacillus salinus]|uniref:ABC transporter permease n=1 Tax=Caldalkalibacillus salinus TaxID=2803787 RepID=UPI001920F70E|nr:ABC transporter permease [Caldalkalibacillus salinus]